MKKSTLVYFILFLFPYIGWAQSQYALPEGLVKSGALTAMANDWEAIGINPANLGWDNNDKISFSLINFGVGLQSGGLSTHDIKTILNKNDTNQPTAAKEMLASGHGPSLFADMNWFAFSIKIDKIGTFAINLCDKAVGNFTLSPSGASLITQKGYIGDSVALHKLIGTSLELYQYREFNLAFGRELFEIGGQNSEADYYESYNVRYSGYMGDKVDTEPKTPVSDSNAIKIYGGIGLKYIWGESYFNGDVDAYGINAEYAVPDNFPAFSPLANTNPGHGLAADLGVSATYKKWTFGISATDLGSITWHQSAFTVADTTIFGLNSIQKTINKLDSNKVVDFKKNTNVTMMLPSKLRLGAAYQLSRQVAFSSDLIFPLNAATSNLAGPYFALGTQVGIWKILILNAGIATTTYYGTSVPFGISLCAGHAVQMYFGTTDILTYLGKTTNGNVSAAYGMIRVNIRGKKKA